MNNQKSNITAAIIFNGAMVAVFLQALLRPEANADWIFRGAFLIFIFEFLAIFAQLWPIKLIEDWRKESKVDKAVVIGQGLFISAGILGFAIIFSYLAGNILAAAYFTISMGSKAYTHLNTKADLHSIYVSILIFIGTLFLSTFLTQVWTTLFPFSNEVLANKLDNSSGLFVDFPQVQLAWGVLYFSILTLYELKKEKNDSWLYKHQSK